ncbi:M14 family metallopeptidase [Halobacteriovorax sp. GB3]|uniref:M14 family metallopeptidase n=1 Tax=Halobacteriovorax sp. GB3 TaxID=2719615 RepID=UPI0023610854|nr:M14 family metallopeptidase [Halobacteriovorax sp. GB3]MDD0852222.1 M14 family metallopeptidase [Halobacteriovorax sp. GB3]
MKLTTMTLSLLLSYSAFAHDPSDAIKTTVHLKNYHTDMQKIQKLDFDVAGVDIKNKVVDLLLTKDQIEKIQELGFVYQVDWKKERKALDEGYKTHQEIESILKEYVRRFPKIAKIYKIGKSFENRDILALKISDHVEKDEIDEPSILFNSMHHAREVMSPEVSLDIIDQLLTQYESNQTYRGYVDRSEIWVVPMLNVDGNAKVWDGSRMWRKNTRLSNGVDINRNYPYKWGECRGSSGSAWSQTYRGPSAQSEPETKALMGLVKKIRPVFNISYHAYSEIVIYPQGCKGQRANNKEIVEPIGKEMGRLIDYQAGTAWELLYSVDGSDIDWMHDAYQVIPYVVEVNSRREGFQPNYEQWRDKTVERNRAAWQYLFERLHGPAASGVVPAKYKKDARIHVYNNENQLMQIYRVNDDGSFHIILNEGKYRFELHTNKKQHASIVANVAKSNFQLNF